jgi:hypothetical protein
MIRRAIGKPWNTCSLRHSSRKRPLRTTKGVLDRLTRRDVMPSDAAFFLPPQDGARSELGAVVADDHQRLSAGREDGVELARHAPAGDRRVDDQRQASAGEVVDNNEHPEATAIGQHVRDEVQVPARWLASCGKVIGARVSGPFCGHHDDEPSTALPGRSGTASCGLMPSRRGRIAGADSRTAGIRQQGDATARETHCHRHAR